MDRAPLCEYVIKRGLATQDNISLPLGCQWTAWPGGTVWEIPLKFSRIVRGICLVSPALSRKWRIIVKNNHIAILILLLVTGLLVPACSAADDSAKARDGNTVQVNYTGKLADGTVFDSSIGRQPLEVILGKGQVIPGFEKAILGMQVGENKTVTIPANDAYGPYRKELIFEVPKENLPAGVIPQVGQQLRGSKADGSTMIATITKISDKTVTLDSNIPLAGKDLTFEIGLVKILPVP
jgi:peptidylprolyl isomerase